MLLPLPDIIRDAAARGLARAEKTKSVAVVKKSTLHFGTHVCINSVGVWCIVPIWCDGALD